MKGHRIVVDWDGTAVPNAWPEQQTEFMPGFVEAMRRFHKAGCIITIDSCRLNPHSPYDVFTRTPYYESMAAGNRQYMRAMLDNAGLTFVILHQGEGKPSGAVYIDDKAERYSGRTKAWEAMADKVLLRLGKEDAAFAQEVAHG